MKKWLNLFWAIIKDEAGLVPLLLGLGAGAIAGGGLMSALGGGDDEEIYDPYAAERGNYTKYLSGKLGSSTPYQYNPDFEIPKPAIETQTEGVISGKLGNLPKAETYKAQVEAAKTQDISREKEAALMQKNEESQMYNRLGLVSSTPWMERAGELGDESLMRQGDISSKYDMYGLDYNLKADQLAEQIANQWTTQGQTLGAAQRGYSQYPISMSEQDVSRQSTEEQQWAQLMQQYLLGQPAERTLTPNIWSQLGGTLGNIGSLGMMAGISGMGAKTLGATKPINPISGLPYTI